MPILTQGDCSLCPSNDFPGVVSAVLFCCSKGFPLKGLSTLIGCKLMEGKLALCSHINLGLTRN